MAIDTSAERISAIAPFIGLRILLPSGSVDQSNRQASARTPTTILAIPPIVALDGAITLIAAVNATQSLDVAVSSAFSLKPAVLGTPEMNN